MWILYVVFVYGFFFFKQKTAYEMRISDWSSDVCSSDLAAMADVYAARSGADREDIVKWMDAETFMSGSTAVERGFASALLAADQVTTDEDAKAEDRSVNELRAMELALVTAGMTRSQARARIKIGRAHV